ncbi:MAG: AlpA family phage regulatory protein [Bradyrhizobium sp.]|uniref:helix-turn-helix transcriptional regulator n=1 Tax=Bradyrhizobium sp. TaxID=376 RepID=UPI0011FA192E|nr:AlpA family phage regulatory protein [Bradyrhizobium sp.]THD54560.1 MAG: AlpA family phage regulatory protein [Bradyrhizobium sp.]
MPIEPNSPFELANQRLISRRQLQQLLPISATTIWRLEKNGRFPKHVTIGGLNFWRVTEIHEYLSRAQ